MVGNKNIISDSLKDDGHGNDCYFAVSLFHSHVRKETLRVCVRERKKLELCEGKRLPDGIYSVFFFFPPVQRLSNPDGKLSMTRPYTISLPTSVHTSVALPAVRCAWTSVCASFVSGVHSIFSLEIYRYPSLYLDNLLHWNHYVRCQYIKRSLFELYFLQAVGVSQAAHSLGIVSV